MRVAARQLFPISRRQAVENIENFLIQRLEFTFARKSKCKVIEERVHKSCIRKIARRSLLMYKCQGVFMSHRGASVQKGFVGIVFLAIALIGIVIAAIAFMSRSSAGNVASESDKTNASIIIKQAADFKTGVDRMVATGIAPSSITFDQTVGTGIFDPTPGAQYAINTSPPTSAFVPSSSTPGYTYNVWIKLPGIGDPTREDFIVTAGGERGLTLSVCKQINKLLYNDPISQMPARSTANIGDWTDGASVDDNGSAAANYQGRPEGCIDAGDGNYVYYKALVEN